jgi:hypothetical protein
MNNIGFALGLSAGLFVGNTLAHRFLLGRPWCDAFGIGLTAAIIGTIVTLI